MNSRDRVKLALNCQKPDKIPKALGFFAEDLDMFEFSDPERHLALDVRFVEFNAPVGQEKFLQYLDRLPKDVHVGSRAQMQTYFEWNYHPESEAAGPLGDIRSLAELKSYVFPDLSHPDRHQGLKKQVSQWHEEGLTVVGSPPHLGGVMFEIAGRLRGFEQILLDMVLRKELLHFFLEQLTSILLHNSLILAKSGVDVLILDDDVASPTHLMISPAMWREFFKSRMAKVIRLAREESPELLIFYHCDGNFTELIPDLIEIGVNVINPIQPDCMDALSIKKEYGGQIAMWGTVGSALLWTKGTPDQIRKEVHHRIKTLGPDGLLLAPAYDLDYVPTENIMAFIEAVDKWG
jgi:uroporphyrinogen decarboxylase